MRLAHLIALSLLIVIPIGCDRSDAPGQTTAKGEEGVQEIDWDALIPADWRP